MPQNEAMNIPSSRSLRALVPLAATLLLAAACSSGSSSSNWTFAPPTAAASGGPAASGSASPSASASASASTAPSATPSASPSSSEATSPSPSAGAGNTIQLNETADLHITDASGQPASSIPAKKGQTYTFEITNTAGFAHDFYIGKPDDLQAGNTANLTGVPEFASGTKTFTYTFDTDGPVGFGCTVPGHYQTMHGTFDIGS
jgi:uncharacterized cupredoxin-like copper-binding protein